MCLMISDVSISSQMAIAIQSESVLRRETLLLADVSSTHRFSGEKREGELLKGEFLRLDAHLVIEPNRFELPSHGGRDGTKEGRTTTTGEDLLSDLLGKSMDDLTEGNTVNQKYINHTQMLSSILYCICI